MSARDTWSDDEFLPAALAASRRTPPAAVTLFVLCVCLLVATLLTWAHFATLDEVTVGDGKVIPSRKMQVVQNLEGGIVKEVLVSDGDIVQPDQVIVRIDDTGFAANYGEARVKALNLMAAVARLEAELEGQQPKFPAEVMKERPDFAETERANFMARQAGQRAEQATLRQQLSQRESELLELRNKVGKLDRSHRLLIEELQTTKPLVASGAVAQVEVLRLERQVNEVKGDLDGTRLAIPRAEAAIQEIRGKMEERQTFYRADAFKELTAKRAELAGVSQSITAVRDRVSRTEVRSPVRGVVQQVKVRTIGGVVRPGDDIVEIVPIDDTLLIEARVRPADIAFIRPDQPATVKLTAYDFSVYGALKGRVERISADTVTDQKSGESFYVIEVRTDSAQLSGTKEPLPVIPGMVATVDVLTGKKSVLDYLLKPFLKAKERALRER